MNILLTVVWLCAGLTLALGWSIVGRTSRIRISCNRMKMMGDSYDTAMLENPDNDHITVVDGVPTIQYSPDETLAISESRYFIRKYMGSVLRALTRDFDRVYRARFYNGASNSEYKRLQWSTIRAAATESARSSSFRQEGEEFQRGSPAEAKRLFLRNRLGNTLANYQIPAGAFFRAIDIEAPDWDLSTYSDYKPDVSLRTPDGSLVTIEGDGAGGTSHVDPEEQQLIHDLKELKARLDSKDSTSFERATDVIIHLAVLEKGMPKALGVCLKETENVILKTIPILKKDQERKKAAKARKLKENPRLGNPNKKRRGPRAKHVAKANLESKKMQQESKDAEALEMAMRTAIDDSRAIPPVLSSGGSGGVKKRSWTPGTVKVPKYMDQGVSSEDGWV